MFKEFKGNAKKWLSHLRVGRDEKEHAILEILCMAVNKSALLNFEQEKVVQSTLTTIRNMGGVKASGNEAQFAILNLATYINSCRVTAEELIC